MIFTWGFRCN